MTIETPPTTPATSGSSVAPKPKRRRIWLYLLLALLLILVLSVAGFVIWALNGPEPMPEALAALASDDAVTVTTGNPIVFTPTSGAPACALIFYQGGKVPVEAYAPGLRDIAAQGVLVVAPSLPLNLAVLAPNRAANLIPDYPGVETWLIGGHSLGGAMAASYANSHPAAEANGVQGLVLWASFPAGSANMSARTDLEVASIYGENDGLALVADIDASRPLLPADTAFTLIAGGNHAQFGWYGPQDGDGEATISREDQTAQTVAASLATIRSACE